MKKHNRMNAVLLVIENETTKKVFTYFILFFGVWVHANLRTVICLMGIDTQALWYRTIAFIWVHRMGSHLTFCCCCISLVLTHFLFHFFCHAIIYCAIHQRYHTFSWICACECVGKWFNQTMTLKPVCCACSFEYGAEYLWICQNSMASKGN